MSIGSNCAGNLAAAYLFPGQIKSFKVPLKLVEPVEQLQAECRGFTVYPVGSSRTGGILELIGSEQYGFHKLFGLFPHDPEGPFEG